MSTVHQNRQQFCAICQQFIITVNNPSTFRRYVEVFYILLLIRVCSVTRCMGVLIRHIHNRDLAGENIMTAYVRVRMMMSCAPGSIGDLHERLKEAGIPLAADRRSMLLLADHYVRERGAVAGEFRVHLTRSRRNSRQCRTHRSRRRIRGSR